MKATYDVNQCKCDLLAVLRFDRALNEGMIEAEICKRFGRCYTNETYTQAIFDLAINGACDEYVTSVSGWYVKITKIAKDTLTTYDVMAIPRGLN